MQLVLEILDSSSILISPCPVWSVFCCIASILAPRLCKSAWIAELICVAVCASLLASILEKEDIREVRSAGLGGQCSGIPPVELGLADMSPVGDWSSLSRVLSSKGTVEAGERQAGAEEPMAGLDGTDLCRGAGSTSVMSSSPSFTTPCCVAATILDVSVAGDTSSNSWEWSLLACPTGIKVFPRPYRDAGMRCGAGPQCVATAGIVVPERYRAP